MEIWGYGWNFHQSTEPDRIKTELEEYMNIEKQIARGILSDEQGLSD